MGQMAYLDAGAGSARPGYPRPENEARTPGNHHAERGEADFPAESRGGGTRTPGLRFWRPPLYQLSYAPGLRGL
jgi:hypothetical protein